MPIHIDTTRALLWVEARFVIEDLVKVLKDVRSEFLEYPGAQWRQVSAAIQSAEGFLRKEDPEDPKIIGN